MEGMWCRINTTGEAEMVMKSVCCPLEKMVSWVLGRLRLICYVFEASGAEILSQQRRDMCVLLQKTTG